MREFESSDFLEEIGEGWLAISGSGQGLEVFSDDRVAKMNRPNRLDCVDTAHLSRYNGTDFVQWYGRKADGRFYAIGRIMRLTKKGKRLLKLNTATLRS